MAGGIYLANGTLDEFKDIIGDENAKIIEL